jgi:hypothetical protein
MAKVRCLFAAFILALSATAALAGASSVPTDYQPDPALKRASRGELEARVRKSCTVTQAKLQRVPEPTVSSPCACYAAATLRSLDPGELQAYRDTGVFNDTARGKALAAVDACKLRRPI